MVFYEAVKTKLQLLKWWIALLSTVYLYKNLYPVYKTIGFPNTYPLDRDLSDG